MSKANIENEDFFVLRTPRMPVNHLQSLGQDREKNRDLIKQWLAMPNVIEALYLATPSLIDSIEQWRKKPESKQGKKTEQSLLKYMIRMCSRPTPFGLFSGINLGEINELETSVRSESYTADERKTRLDMFYLSAIKQHIQQDDVRNDALIYYPNSSHYFIDQQCRYIETYQSKKTRQYRLSGIEADEYFLFFLDIAKSGKTFDELVSAFLAHSSDQSLVRSLNKLGKNQIVDALETSLFQLANIDKAGKANIDEYKSIYKGLKQQPVEVEEGKLFQVDTYRKYHSCQLNQQQVTQLSRQLTLIKELGSTPDSSFTDFIKRFNERYEGQFVRLDKLLDDETGISFSHETGYESLLLAGINLAKSKFSRPFAPSVSRLQHLVAKAVFSPENRGEQVVTLKSKALKKELPKESKLDTLPASYGAIVSLFEDEQGRPLINFSGAFGPSAANLLGRFCHLNEDLVEKVRGHLQKEQAHSPAVVFAEIAHLPEGRPGNVIARPHLREYEIVFMADSELTSEFQLPVSDLYVWVEAGQVKIWSKRLQKQVVPRLSSAHNYSSRSLSIYKFLSMTQSQSHTSPNFALPSSLSQATFVPRIMLDNLVLSLKTWRIDRTEIEGLIKDQKLDQERLQALMDKYQLDQEVSYAVSDNVLQLNLASPQLIEILLAETKGRKVVELKEVLTSQYKTPIKGEGEDYYANELIIPFFNQGAKPFTTLKADPQKNIEAKPVKRRFTPGTEWLSVKLYSGNSYVDGILAEQLLPLIESSKALYDKWFFIRYSDPDWHLRLRFNGEPQTLFGQLLPLLTQHLDPLVESGSIHKIEIFTYEREVERYGGPISMAAAESLFSSDSKLVARTVQLESEIDEEIRWRVALLATDKLLTLFNYKEDEKLALLTSLRDGFGREFEETSILRKQLGNRFREVEGKLKSDFALYKKAEDTTPSEEQTAMFRLIEQWAQEAAPHVQKICDMYDSEQGLNCSKNDLLSSLLHMHNNRMFKAYGREQEFVMHDFLRRLYFSKSKGR